MQHCPTNMLTCFVALLMACFRSWAKLASSPHSVGHTIIDMPHVPCHAAGKAKHVHTSMAALASLLAGPSMPLLLHRVWTSISP